MIHVKLLIINILTTKHTVCEKGNLFPFLKHCTLICQNTYIRFFNNFWQQGLQIAAWQKRYSKCKSKNINLSGEIENNFPKNLHFALKNVSWVILQFTIYTALSQCIIPLRCTCAFYHCTVEVHSTTALDNCEHYIGILLMVL